MKEQIGINFSRRSMSVGGVKSILRSGKTWWSIISSTTRVS